MSYSTRSLLLFVQTPAAPPSGVRYRSIMMVGMWLLMLCGLMALLPAAALAAKDPTPKAADPHWWRTTIRVLDYTSAEWEGGIRDAVGQWDDASRLELVYERKPPQDDCTDLRWVDGAIVLCVRQSSDGASRGGIETNRKGTRIVAGFIWYDVDQIHLPFVRLHELGHTLGFDHQPMPGNNLTVMAPDSWTMTELGPGDMALIEQYGYAR